MALIDCHVNLLPAFARSNVSSAAIPGESEHLRHCFDLPATAAINARCHAGEIITCMDRAGLDVAVVFSYQFNDMERCRIANRETVAAVARFPDRLRGLAVVQPRHTGAVSELEWFLSQPGMIGLKTKPRWAGYSLADRRVVGPLAETLIARNAILLTHVTQGFHRPTGDQLSDLVQLLKDFPKLKVVAAHLGGFVGVYELYKPIAKHFENLFIDISLPANLAWLPHLLRLSDPRRYLFATDFPYAEFDDVLARLDQVGLTDHEKEMVCTSNPARLLSGVRSGL